MHILLSGSYLEFTTGNAILLSDVWFISISRDAFMAELPPPRMLPYLGELSLLFRVTVFVRIQELFYKALRSSEKFRLELWELLSVVD